MWVIDCLSEIRFILWVKRVCCDTMSERDSRPPLSRKALKKQSFLGFSWAIKEKHKDKHWKYGLCHVSVGLKLKCIILSVHKFSRGNGIWRQVLRWRLRQWPKVSREMAYSLACGEVIIPQTQQPDDRSVVSTGSEGKKRFCDREVQGKCCCLLESFSRWKTYQRQPIAHSFSDSFWTF